ncbi:MAG TPA: hypothetical protein VF469_35590 [Kofleriaceae bacterium]
MHVVRTTPSTAGDALIAAGRGRLLASRLHEELAIFPSAIKEQP